MMDYHLMRARSILLLLLATSCVHTTSPPPSPTAGVLPTGTSTPTPVVPTPTALPSATPSYCIPPSTPYPVPTLTQAEFDLFTRFPPSRDDCRFPCWNGLTPGASTSDEAFRGLWSLGANSHEVDMRAPPLTMYGAASNTSEDAWGFGLTRDCIVNFIYIWPAYPGREALFSELGTPTTALMEIAGPGALPGGPFVELFLDYPEMHTAIHMTTEPTRRARLCLDKSEVYYFAVLVYSPAVDPLRVVTTGHGAYFADTLEFTGLSQEEFAKKLSTPSECIRITSGW